MLGDGGGVFTFSASYQVGDGPDSIAVADFDGDHRPDLAVANYPLPMDRADFEEPKRRRARNVLSFTIHDRMAEIRDMRPTRNESGRYKARIAPK
jgi:hypothetical protein